MLEFKETDPRFIFLKGKILLFIGVAVVGSIILMFFIGKQRGLFVKTEDFYFVTSKATGLRQGMPVKVSGFKIGRLKDMKLEDDGTVKVILSIEQPHIKWLREDSLAVLTKEGFIGDSSIEIIPGKGKSLNPGQAIKFEKEKGLEEMAFELKTELVEILEGVRETIKYVNAPEGEVKKILKNLEKVSQNLVKTTELANSLLDDLNKKTPSITEKSEKTIEELHQLIKTTRQSIDNISNDLSRITNKAGKDLPSIVEQTRKSLQELDEILQSVKGLWPIRTGIKKQEPRPVEADSYEK